MDCECREGRKRNGRTIDEEEGEEECWGVEGEREEVTEGALEDLGSRVRAGGRVAPEIGRSI